MRGPKPPAWFEGDGCSCAPDRIFDHEFSEACRWHDYCYRYDVSISRWKADWYLYCNLVELGCHRRWAIWYWFAVRVFGWKFWNKKSKNQ